MLQYSNKNVNQDYKIWNTQCQRSSDTSQGQAFYLATHSGFECQSPDHLYGQHRINYILGSDLGNERTFTATGIQSKAQNSMLKTNLPIKKGYREKTNALHTGTGFSRNFTTALWNIRGCYMTFHMPLIK